MINANCLVMTPELKELNSQFPKLPSKLFRDYVSRWQYEYGREGEIPTKDELIRLITKVSDNWADYINPDEVKVTNIYAGANQNTILSNFANRPFFLTGLSEGTADEQVLFDLLDPVLEYEHMVFSSVEQAFQMMKMLLPSMQEFTPEALANGVTAEEKARIDKADAVVEKMKRTNNPSALKGLGATRGILTDSELQMWDSNKKAIMKALIRASLKQNPKALQALLATGNSSLTHIQDRSTWRTQFPIILEELREEFRGTQVGDNFNPISNTEVIPMLGDNSVKVYDKSNTVEGVKITKNGNTYNISVPNEFDLDKSRATNFVQALYDLIPSGAEVTSSNDPKSKTILNLVKEKGLISKDLGRETKSSNKPIVTKIISGGQTGVDTIGLQVAKELGIETGGTAPKGFLRERGVDSEDISSYGLTEITSEQQADYTKRKGKRDPYTGRTELNVRNSDGTVYFYTSSDSAGYTATKRSADEWGKPFLANPTAKELADWIAKNNIKVLNVAGNRGSKLSNPEEVANVLRKALIIQQQSSDTNLSSTEEQSPEEDIPLGSELNNSIKESRKPTVLNESTAYKRINAVLQNLINKIDESGIKSAIPARNLYSWTIQANQVILDAIESGSREDELVNPDNVQDTINNLISKTPKELGDAFIQALKEMSKDFGKSMRGALAITQQQSSDITIPVWQKPEVNTSETSGYIINEHEGRWTRDEVENDPRTLYIFTDNTDRTSGGEEIGDGWYAEKYGKGGFGTVNNPTSAVIRGLPNAAPISTMKWFYREHGVSVEQARWTDSDLEEFKEVIDDEIEQIKQLWDSGNFNSIELPQNGIFGKSIKSDRGRSIARLTATRTPKLYQYLNKKLQELSEYVQDTKKAKEYESESSNIDESNWHKIDTEFTSIKKRQRINLINDLFTREVEKAQEATVARLNDEMAKASTIGEKLRLAKAIKNLRPFVVIKQEKPLELFDKVKAVFEDLLYATENNRQAYIDKEIANMENTRESKLPLSVKKRIAESRINYQVEAYKQILDNWGSLVMDAANTYSYDHGVIIDVTVNNIEEDIDDTPTDDEGNNQNKQIADEKEETPYKEGWQVKVRELSAFESMTNQVRQAIGRIYRRDRNGDIVTDDLGFPQKLQQSYVFAELISALKDMTNAKQMMPMLEALQARKPWAVQIVDAIKNDERLFTSFYRVFRKDYLNMWIQIESTAPDGSVTIKTHNINKPAGTAHYFDEWRDNFEYGIILDEDSIYDQNGEIRLDKAELGLKLVDAAMDKFRGLKSKEEKQQVILENAESIHKLLSMLGIFVTSDTLNDILTFNANLNNKAELPGSIVLSNLRTIFKDMPTNDGIKNGEPADLINIYGRAFNNIATAINNVEEDEVESSVRQGKKTLYAHTRPSYATTLVKKLRGSESKEFIESEYKPVDFLYDKEQGRWLNSLIDDLENDADARDKFNHIVVIEHNRKEYQQWTPLDTFLTLFNQYNAEPIKGGEGYAWYQMPLLSDATSAEFLRAKRVRKNYEEVLLDKFADVVRQEYNRIITVKQRNNTPNIKKIAYYDMTDDDEGGAKFHFFPKLNTEAFNKDGKTFFEQLAEVADDTDAFNQRAKEAVQTIMNEDFIAALDNWASIGVFDRVDENNENSSFKYFKQRTRENIEAALREYYWNTTYMQSQIIQLMTTDLAYYGNYTNFTKRALEFHSPTEKLNTLAKWNGEYVLASEDESGNVTVRPERVIYLTDEVKPSNWMKDVEEIIDQKIARGELTEYDKTVILKKWGKTNVTDAQAFRTLKSFRATQIAADMWSDDAETAYNNIRKGTWTARDFVILWNTRKPYLYTQTNQSDRVGGIMRLAVQHKNSEMIMLTQAIFGSILHQSGKLRGLSEFMEDKNIDVAMFGTAVKVCGQGFIDLNGIENAEDAKSKLQKEVYIGGTDTINPEVVHEYNWDDYGIQVATPEHGINAPQLVGTQIRRLIGTDMGADAAFKVGNKSLTRDQWRDYFNAVNTANIREAFEKLDKEFRDPKKISDLLISEIKSNSRYSNDLIEAVTLNKEGQFNIPIFDPSQSQKLQELLNSIVKSRIVKQEINGGSLIQATAWALNDKDRPQIVWGTDKNGQRYIKYMEAYIACPDDKLYELLLEDDGSININKKDSKGNYIVPAKYREAIGYRIPTEDKYSMIPIKVKGFLPRQVGSVIILPEEITTTTGSDFDVDKIYMMYHSLNFKDIYDIKAAWDDFYKSHPDIVESIEESKRINFKRAMDEAIEKNPEVDLSHYDMDELFEDFVRPYKNYMWVKGVKEAFSAWFNPIKDRYLSQKSIEVVTYNDTDIDLSDSNKNRKVDIYRQAKKNTKTQRDSMIIDLMWSVLTNPDTVGKMINPGNFDEQKRDARIVNLLDSLSLDEIDKLGGINKILNLSLKDADKMLEKYGKIVNPLTPDTWITYQQRNMSGAGLVPMAATQNASHALTQLTKNFGLKKPYRFIFNGKRLGSLNSVKSANDKFISRNVCSYLTAFVDNAKDPVAGDLNINNNTANLAFLLLRIGNSPITTSLILRQPAMMKVMKYVNSGKYSMSQAIEEAMEDYKKQRGNSPYGGKTIDFNFTDEWLAANIAAEKNGGDIHSSHIEEMEFAVNQIKVLVMLKQMSEAADALGDVVRRIRSDSQSGGAGGSIAAGNDKIDGLDKILNNAATKASYPLQGLDFVNEMMMSRTEEDIINSTLPIQTATFQWGLMATHDWYAKLFPQVSEQFREVVDLAKGFTTYGNLDDTTINRVYSQYLIYLMTGISKDFRGDADTRNYYINEFPVEFNEFKSKNPYLIESVPLLRRLRVLFSNKYNGSPTIVFNNVGKVTDIQSEDYRSDFRNLLANKSTRDMVAKLLRYAFYRGLGFSPSGFSNLIPTQLKMSDVTDYVATLRDILDMKTTVDHFQFMYQYIRNNMDDRRFVPEVSMTGILKGEPEDSFLVVVTKNSSQDMKRFIYPMEGEDVRYREFVCYTYKGGKYYYSYDSKSGFYKRIKPLGSSQYQEYDYNTMGLVMESQIKEAKQRGFNFREDYRAANLIESVMAQPEISEGAYKNMPSFDDMPAPTLDDLYSTSREARAAQMAAQWQELDKQFEPRTPTAEDLSRLDAMEQFENFSRLDAMSQDLEGNNKCK